MNDEQGKIELEKIEDLFDTDTLKNSVTDLYKVVRHVFRDTILTYDKIQIDMHNTMLQRELLRYFQEAYINGECEMPEAWRLLQGWTEKFAYQAKREKISQENYIFLSGGIIFGITNMIREFQEMKQRGL